MAQEDFERFKQEIKSWMDAHPDEYVAFVEKVNGKSFEGIQRVYSLATRLAPQLMAKAKEQVHGDLNRTEPDASIFTADDTLAEQLVAVFHNTEKSSFVPAILWHRDKRNYLKPAHVGAKAITAADARRIPKCAPKDRTAITKAD